ncbi:Rrf2 family transcriptional regulator [bacterium]|nr:Rrf2 family transcriptional regulator [bacterium]
MTISRTAEYALRAVIWLAGHPTEALGTKAISDAVQIPPGYLSKVLQILARSGIVSSSPGRTGGFRLDRDPASLSVLDVISAVDPIQRIHACPLHLKGHANRLCPLHGRLDKAMGEMEDAFARSTVAELLAEETTSPPLRELGFDMV